MVAHLTMWVHIAAAIDFRGQIEQHSQLSSLSLTGNRVNVHAITQFVIYCSTTYSHNRVYYVRCI